MTPEKRWSKGGLPTPKSLILKSYPPLMDADSSPNPEVPGVESGHPANQRRHARYSPGVQAVDSILLDLVLVHVLGETISISR